MCTLIVLKDVFEEYPFVVASNRDEHPGRPSSPPSFWYVDQCMYAPRDWVRGGTWIGVNCLGVFAALTNRDDVAHQSGCLSRGRLVTDMLDYENAERSTNHLSGLWDGEVDDDCWLPSFGRQPPPKYNGFNLLVADRERCLLVVGDSKRLRIITLGSGAHIITGYGMGAFHGARATEITRRLRDIKNPSPEELDRLLNFHADGTPEAAACVHDPDEYHKTISSMIVRADRDWTRFETWFRAGPACSGPFDERFDVEFRKNRSWP